MTDDEENKPTVVLDLNALKKQKLKQEEDLSFLDQDIEFSVNSLSESKVEEKQQVTPLEQKEKIPSLPIIFFDFQSDFFQKELKNLPTDFEYHIVKDLPGLNKFLTLMKFQLIVFNYDVSPRAVNQLTTQIRQKFPQAKTLIVAKSISPEKAKVHAKTLSGADGYFQLPFQKDKFKTEIQKIYSQSVKKK